MNDHDPLIRLERALARHRPEVLADLRRPGASPAAIDAFEARTGLRIPPLVRRWLGWVDGKAAPSFVGPWTPIPLAAIESRWATLQGLYVADPRGERRHLGAWDRDWLPLFDNGAGDLLCVDLVGSLGGPAGQMIVFYHDTGYRALGPASFEAWIELVVAAVALGGPTIDLEEAAFRHVDVGRLGSLDPIREARTELGLAAESPLRFERCPLERLDPTGFDPERRALYPQLFGGVRSLLEAAIELADAGAPERPVHAVAHRLRSVGDASDGNPLVRAALEREGGGSTALDEYAAPVASRRLDDGRLCVFGVSSIWLLRADPDHGWVPLDRLAMPRGFFADRAHWIDRATGGPIAAIESATRDTLPVVAIDGARLRWLGAPSLPTPGDLEMRDLAALRGRVYLVLSRDEPGGELYELLGVDV
ncbi:MAG: SMI1/KNR4 family protein [Nannocystaceae bacterium]